MNTFRSLFYLTITILDPTVVKKYIHIFYPTCDWIKHRRWRPSTYLLYTPISDQGVGTGYSCRKILYSSLLSLYHSRVSRLFEKHIDSGQRRLYQHYISGIY